MDVQAAEAPDQAALLQKARRRQEVRVAVIGPLMFVGSLVGVLVSLRLQHPRGAFLPVGAVILLLALCALPWLAMLGLLALIRHGRFAALQPIALMGLSRQKRRQILRALRRGDGLVVSDVPIAQELVAAMRRSRWLPWLFAVLPLFQLGNLAAGHTQRVLWILAAGAMWPSAWWQLYLRHRIRLYADIHWRA